MEERKNIEIGKKLKELRKSAGLTQEQLASKLGLSRVNYTRYEVGAVRPDYETIILLADFYDISLDELFGRNSYFNDLDGWTGRYGMPLEFLLSLHLSSSSIVASNKLSL